VSTFIRRTASESRSLGASIFSQRNAFSITGETRKAIVQSHGDEVVDYSTGVDQQQWRIDRPELCGFVERRR